MRIQHAPFRMVYNNGSHPLAQGGTDGSAFFTKGTGFFERIRKDAHLPWREDAWIGTAVASVR